MAITSYDDIVAAYSNGAVSEDVYYCGASGEGNFTEAYLTLPSWPTNLTGVICDSNTPGVAPWFPLPANDVLLLNTVQKGGSASGLMAFDMLWYGIYNNTGITAKTGDQVVFDQPPLTRYANGDNVFVLVQVGGSSGVLNLSLAFKLTDNLGRTEQLTWGGMRACSYSETTSLASWTQAQVLPPPHGSGGVRKVESFTMDINGGVTISLGFTITVALVRPLCMLPVSAGENPITNSLSEMASNIVRLPKGSANDQACIVVVGERGVLSGTSDNRYWHFVDA